MSNRTIEITGSGYAFALLPEAISLKSEMLIRASEITEIVDEDTQALALHTCGTLKGLSKRCEESRKEVKAPVLKLGKDIDKLAEDFTKEIDVEISRIEKLAGEFIQKQRAKQQASEQALQRERERLAKLQSEQASSGRQASEFDDEVSFAQMAIGEISEDLKKTEVKPVAGAAVRETFQIEVLSVSELFKAFPECVELTVKKSILNDLVNRRGVRDIPGVKITPIIDVATRSINPTLK